MASDVLPQSLRPYAFMHSSPAPILKLSWFLYICLPKAVIHTNQWMEIEWLKCLLHGSYCSCYYPCTVDDWRALEAAPELQFWPPCMNANGMILSLQIFNFYANVACGLELSVGSADSIKLCCYGSAAQTILAGYCTVNLAQNKLCLPPWLWGGSWIN